MFDRRLLTALAIATVASTSSLAQTSAAPAAAKAPVSLKGTWVGFANTQNGKQRLTFVFDSTEKGWVGASYAPEMGPDSLYFDDVKVKGDSLTFSLTFQNTPIGIRGLHSGNIYDADVWVQGQNAGTVRLAKAGSAEAAELLSSPFDDEQRRRRQ
jgi:hypothetical protein